MVEPTKHATQRNSKPQGTRHPSLYRHLKRRLGGAHLNQDSTGAYGLTRKSCYT